ncbi:ninein homolog isoform X2 [Tribolium castaneum]|nr:PREDICTED: ninein isoform X1 [Tribolium castaneum]XP_015838740.1 PREDICTED: ninein isoform X1 [Tribolium castaneum]|eukprot:XP_015838739.1 PREDICTED: ninein isoform X1 [Tribolium castaneum]
MDPYEQQLLTVFDSYDHEHLGSLDRDGLTQLCQTLQLEEHSSDLIQCLLTDKHPRATFAEFKDALLTLLDTMQHRKNTDDSKKTESPDREVSPKFIYGSKKYGRRSRPRSDEITNMLDEQNDLNYLNKNSNAVQRSNSQSEVSNSKKRKTNYKLKRCTSLPATQRNFVANNMNNETEFVYTEEMLREAWKKLEVGKDGYLNQNELVLVCDAIGLHNLAKGVMRQLSDRLSVDYDKISFQELLEALQMDETWTEVLNSPVNDVTLTVTNEIFPDSRTFQYVTLGPDGNGVINAETLIEMWELVGISSPKELIHELGFNDREINIIELATVLEKEIKGIHDSSRLEMQNPHIALLHANLTLYQSEIKCLKHVLEQMHAEREKLKCDVFEANNRAKLLAQEVDDNHVKMERNTQNQVRLIEQRHSDILKEITQQYAGDKEHLSALNQTLEAKICSLEQEVNKLKNDLVVAQKYSSTLEKENQNLSNQISELQQVKSLLSDQINSLECEKQKYVEMEQEQIEPLLTKLSTLQLENAQLRDRNDEMVAEIESLTCQVSSMRAKVASTPTYNTLDQSMEENISVVCEGVGLGAKRRSDYSPTKDGVLFGIGPSHAMSFAADGSPRLGKVRKFHKERPDHLDVVPFTSNESGFEAEIDAFDSSFSGTDEEITRLQAKVAFLEHTLAQHSIPIPGDYAVENATSDTINSLRARVQELEKLFGDLSDVSKMINKNGLSCDNLKSVGEKLEMILSQRNEKVFSDANVGTDTDLVSFEHRVKQYEEENEMLKTKCSELENCVELLKNEYEKCEDYWQSKLEEERQIFEQEQSQSSEKLTDLINKMAEYEEQFANQDTLDSRLPPIEETYNLEKQFTDLEQEFEDYKLQSENELFKRDEEISILKQKLTDLALSQKDSAEMGTQVNSLDENSRISTKMNSLSLCMVESTNLFSSDAMPVPWSPEKKPEMVDWGKESRSDTNSTQTSLSWQNGSGQPSTSNSSTLEKNSTPCRPKRTRKHDRNNCLYKKNSQEMKKSDDFPSRREEQVVTLPVSTIHGLNGRLHHLEQRCRQLQMVLKQQHFYTEQALQQCRQHHKSEKTELQCILRSHQEKLDQQVRICNDQLERLARSDMLVKELYVENSYLIAKVQRLEQQCHILAQCNSNSSSV